MSAYVFGAVFKHSRAKGPALTVLLAIADKAGDNGVALPQWDTSVDTLAKMARCSVRTVQYAIRELVALGELVVEVHNGKTSNTYQILLDRNHQLFEGPEQVAESPTPETKLAQIERLKVLRESVDNPKARKGGGVQTVAPGGCKVEQKGVQTVAPSPSIPSSPLDPPPRARARRVVDPVDKKPNRPDSAAGMKDWLPTPGTIAWVNGMGHGAFLGLHLEQFRNYTSEPRVFKRYTDLDKAFRNAVMGDWGGVRATSQRAAKVGAGVDLAIWWKSTEGIKAKGALMGLQREEGEAWTGFERRVVIEATRREGWGAWTNENNYPTYHRWAKEALADAPVS